MTTMTASPSSAAHDIQVVTLKIDDQEVSASRNQTILEVARENEIKIPTLCFMPGLKPMGACRICLVEMAGSPRLHAACVTKVAEGMQVITDSPRLRQYRRQIVELLFVERNHVCSVCVSNGRCELQALAVSLGITHISQPYRYEKNVVDSSHDLFRLDHNRCVLCTRCVRVCDQIEGAHVWDVAGRGIDCRITADLNLPWGQSDACTSCGKCVHICPTGALTEKGTAVAEMRKQPGFLPYLTIMRESK